MPIDRTRCRASVPDRGGGVMDHQCYNKAKLDGKWCHIHHPGAVKARRAKRRSSRLERDLAAREARELDLDPGVLWAAARLVEFHDAPTLAAELLVQSGADITRASELDRPYIDKAMAPP